MSSRRNSLRGVLVAVVGLAAALLTGVPAASADTGQRPPNLSAPFLIENAGQPGLLLCADVDSTEVVLRPLELDIDPFCQWQQSGPDGDAVLYNPEKDLVLDINSSGPLTDNMPINLQPYYTNPPQSYEQWTWSDQTGFGGRALRPFDDADLNVNGRTLTATDGKQGMPDMTWLTQTVTADSYPPAKLPDHFNPPPNLSGDVVLQNSGVPGVLCASADDDGVYLRPLSLGVNEYCLWQQGGPSDAPANAYLHNPAKDLVLDVNSSGPLVDNLGVNLQPYYTGPLQTYEWWTFSGQTGFGGQAVRPYDNGDLNLRATSQSGTQPLTINAWKGDLAAMTWSAVPIAVGTGGSDQ